MRRARYTEEQIIEMLKQAEAAGSIREICRVQNIPTPLFVRWQKAYEGRLDYVEPEERETRTARTRKATAVNELGLRLVDLEPETLDALDLPEDLREAIDVCHGLRMRALSRQKRLVCQILRREDHEAIRERLEQLEPPPRKTGGGILTRKEKGRA